MEKLYIIIEIIYNIEFIEKLHSRLRDISISFTQYNVDFITHRSLWSKVTPVFTTLSGSEDLVPIRKYCVRFRICTETNTIEAISERLYTTKMRNSTPNYITSEYRNNWLLRTENVGCQVHNSTMQEDFIE